MRVSPLHKLAEMIRNGEPIEDEDLLETLGEDGTIVVPMEGGGERLLPSGEILSVLADGAGVPVEEVLSHNFRMNEKEIEAANDFIRLVQFAGAGEETPPYQVDNSLEQPFQAVDS
jgi:hypothetical protein